MNSVFFWTMILLVSLTVIWFSAQKVISAVEMLARSWKISAFTFSMLVLGTATSLPEISVVLSSSVLHSPQIAMGNLIGGQVFLLLVIVPLFAVTAGGLTFKEHLKGRSLPLTLLTIALPSLVLVDNLLNWVDAILLAVTYGAFFIFSFRTATTMEKTVKRIEALQITHKSRAMFYIIIGVVLLLAGGFGAVRSLLFLSDIWHWPPFVTGFVVLAVGSNTPELALLVTSLLKRRRTVALGDYIGSATFNTLLAVVLIDMNEGMITFSIPLFLTSILFVAALGLFWFFGATDTKLTVTEATVLLGIYVALTSFQAFFSTVVL